MRRAVYLALAITSFCSPYPAFGESPPSGATDSVVTSQDVPSFRESTQIHVPVPDVAAAYSLDPLVAEAQAEDSQVRIWGRMPGQATIVLVHTDLTTSTLAVRVTQAPPILPDAEYTGLNLNEKDSRGYYESRLSSTPIQLANTFEYQTGRMQLHLANVAAPGRNSLGLSSTWFPYSYLRLFDHGRTLGLLDDNVDSSPISVHSTLLRGVHLAAGGLAIHAGYTSVAGFQSLFLPAHKQFISGATLTHRLGLGSQIGVTGYFIRRDPQGFDFQPSQGVVTAFLKRRMPQGRCFNLIRRCGAFDFSGELGVSHGIGGAFSVAHAAQADQFHVTARYRPRQYAASAVDNLRGLQSDLGWDRVWGKRFVSAVSGSADRFFIGSGAQAIEVSAGNLAYKPFNGMALSSGLSFSRFADNHSLFPDVRRFALPAAVSYDRGRFGVSGQYEYSRTSRAFSAGRGYRGAIRWSGQHFQVNADAGLETQALGIDSVFTAFPSLNAQLALLGLGATTTPAQLVTLLQDRAFLSSLGIAPSATLQLVPRNWHAAVNLSRRWSRHAIEFDANYNLNSFLAQNNTVALQTVRYRGALSDSTELIGAFTLFESVEPIHRLSPIWEIGLRQRLKENPLLPWHQRNGTISGTVRFQDRSGIHPAAAVEITLDGDRRVTSDNEGFYEFSGLRPGAHAVQIAFKSPRPFWYSTPSRVSALPDSVVDFGIIFPAAEIAGYVVSDAGIGLPNIGVLLRGPQGQVNLTTDQTGKFAIPVAQPGTYDARVNAETVPDGYALEELRPISVSVAEGEFSRFSFTLLAIRALSGRVRTYDSMRNEYVPLAGTEVWLAELNRRALADKNGYYLFRDVPSGIFTIIVNGHQYGKIEFSATPQLLRKDLALTP